MEDQPDDAVVEVAAVVEALQEALVEADDQLEDLEGGEEHADAGALLFLLQAIEVHALLEEEVPGLKESAVDLGLGIEEARSSDQERMIFARISTLTVARKSVVEEASTAEAKARRFP